MSSDFQGLLQSPDKPSKAFRVSIVLSDGEVEMSSELGFIGRWPSRDVSVERAADNWFNLRLDEDEWDFHPDDPTGFFLAAPLPTPQAARKQPPVRNRAISELSKLALGAVLAVSLMSAGIVIGRNRLDGTELRVTLMLVSAAALGAGWASIRTSGREMPDREKRSPASLRINGPRPALRVEDVLRTTERQQAPKESQDSGDPERQNPPHNSLADEHETERSPLPMDSSDQLEPMSTTAPEVSSQERRGEEPGDETHTQPQTSSEREGARDAAPHRIDAPRITDQRAIDWRNPETDDTEAVDDEASISDGSVLPTVAIKRYLASVSRLEPEAQSRTHSAEEADEAGGAEHSEMDEATDRSPALTEIRGIGRALSTTLKQLGVSDVHSLAQLDADDLDDLERQLGRFGKRVRSERWVEQARRLTSDP